MTELVAKFPDLAESGLSFLEMASVDAASLKQYVQQMGVFCDWRAAWAKTDCDPEILDADLLSWMNVQFAAGHQAWRGEKLIAAIMALAPSCSKHGWVKLPKSLRAL